jgi:hypothetical protein
MAFLLAGDWPRSIPDGHFRNSQCDTGLLKTFDSITKLEILWTIPDFEYFLTNIPYFLVNTVDFSLNFGFNDLQSQQNFTLNNLPYQLYITANRCFLMIVSMIIRLVVGSNGWMWKIIECSVAVCAIAKEGWCRLAKVIKSLHRQFRLQCK